MFIQGSSSFTVYHIYRLSTIYGIKKVIYTLMT